MTNFTLSRRRFLSALGGGVASLPLVSLPGFVKAAGQQVPQGNVLLLIELAGGNDGLNTVVPFMDPRYHALRPEIGLAQRDLLTLDTDTGLHAAMRPMADLWEGADCRRCWLSRPEPVTFSVNRDLECWAGCTGCDTTRLGIKRVCHRSRQGR